MVSFQVVFRELAIVRKSLLINKDGIFRRDTSKFTDEQRLEIALDMLSGKLLGFSTICFGALR